MASIDDVLNTIDANLPASTDRLFDLLKIPSVSTDPAFKADCARAAQWLADDLNGIGFYLCFVFLSTWLKENYHVSSSLARTTATPRALTRFIRASTASTSAGSKRPHSVSPSTMRRVLPMPISAALAARVPKMARPNWPSSTPTCKSPCAASSASSSKTSPPWPQPNCPPG